MATEHVQEWPGVMRAANLFARGLRASELTAEQAASLIPGAVNMPGVHPETVGNWRRGQTPVPLWAVLGLWEILLRKYGPDRAATFLGLKVLFP